MTQRAHEMAQRVLADLRRVKRLPEDSRPTWDRTKPGERTPSSRVLAMTPPNRVMGRARGEIRTASTAIDLETFQRRQLTPEQRQAARTEQYVDDGTVRGQRFGGKAIARQPLPSRVVRGHMAQLALEARRERTQQQ